MSLTSDRINPTDGRDTWHIADVPTALAAYAEIIAKGYRGAPVFDATQKVIGLEINGDNTHAEARIGDWLVEDIGIRAFTPEVYAANYTTREAE